MAKELRKITSSEIREGMRFSAPVFFDDGQNMFLAEGKTVKKYHLDALKRWSIPFVCTYGEEMHAGQKPSAAGPADGTEEVEELEEL